jgi:hypothetical protein
MGYRSHVLLALSTTTAVTAHLSDPQVVEALSSADEIHTRSWGVIYEWFHTKWYESFEDVQALIKLMDELDKPPVEETEDEDLYSFLRNGDDLNDMEQRGSWNMGIGYGLILKEE